MTNADRHPHLSALLTATIKDLSGGATDESTCTPGPVPPAWRGGGHPSRPTVAGKLQRPTRRHRAGRPQSPAQAPASRRKPSGPCSGWGLPSHPGHPGCWWALTPPFHPYRVPAGAGRGGLLSVALSRGSPRVAVSNHPALWSPDVPRQGRSPDATARSTRPSRDPCYRPSSSVSNLSTSSRASSTRADAVQRAVIAWTTVYAENRH